VHAPHSRFKSRTVPCLEHGKLLSQNSSSHISPRRCSNFLTAASPTPTAPRCNPIPVAQDSQTAAVYTAHAADACPHTFTDSTQPAPAATTPQHSTGNSSCFKQMRCLPAQVRHRCRRRPASDSSTACSHHTCTLRMHPERLLEDVGREASAWGNASWPASCCCCHEQA
jgi:hypothetical protein